MSVRIEDIQRTVAAHYKLSLPDLIGHRRPFRISHPRQLAMLLARELTKASFPDIGRRFGGRDHTTVLHATKAVQRRIANGSRESLDLAAIKEQLSRPGAHSLASRVKAELAAAQFLEAVAAMS